MPSKSWKPRLKVNKNFSQVENNPVNKSSPLLENDSVAQNQSEKNIKKKRTKSQTNKRPVRRCGHSFPEVKNNGSVVFKRTSFVCKHKTTTDSKKAPYRQSPVLFGDQAVFHKVLFNSIKIS